MLVTSLSSIAIFSGLSAGYLILKNLLTNEEVEEVISFEFNDTKKRYLVYTKNEVVQDGLVKLYIAEEDKLEKILENQQVIKTPVVRNGKQSTLGYQPEVWKGWK